MIYAFQLRVQPTRGRLCEFMDDGLYPLRLTQVRRSLHWERGLKRCGGVAGVLIFLENYKKRVPAELPTQ